jgi:hypothetical protein
MGCPCAPGLSLEEEAELNKLIRAPRTQRRHADRALIVLEAFNPSFSQALGNPPKT